MVTKSRGKLQESGRRATERVLTLSVHQYIRNNKKMQYRAFVNPDLFHLLPFIKLLALEGGLIDGALEFYTHS